MVKPVPKPAGAGFSVSGPSKIPIATQSGVLPQNWHSVEWSDEESRGSGVKILRFAQNDSITETFGTSHQSGVNEGFHFAGLPGVEEYTGNEHSLLRNLL